MIFLYLKVVEDITWCKLFVDLKGPYEIRREVYDKPLILKYLTMVDPVTQWFKIVQ